jgi:hypothetical protein
MIILQKLQFLENRDCFIIHCAHGAKSSCIGKNGNGYYIEGKKSTYPYKKLNMDELVADIIELGRKLYEYNKDNIVKIREDCIDDRQVFHYDCLIFKRSTPISEDTANIIKDWCDSDKPVSFTNYDSEDSDEVDCHSLIDLSMFMYLLFSAIQNENIRKLKNKFKREKQEINNNGIRYNDIIDNYTNDYISADYFYNKIINYINSYEDKLINDTSRPVIKESTKLYFEETKDKNNKVVKTLNFKKCFDNIYSFCIYVIKMGIYCAGNGFQIINMCSCGEVILGKAELCTACSKMYDVKRKKDKQK